MKNTLLQKFISGLAVTLVGILYWVATLYQVNGVPDAYGISSRTLPFLVSFVLVLLGSMLVVGSCKRWHRAVARPTESPGTRFSSRKCLRVVTYVGAIALYLLGILYISFTFSTALMVLFSMLFCGQRKRLVLVIVTLLAPLCIYFVFAKIMMIPLPVTWFGY